jgi:hypothetical protein
LDFCLNSFFFLSRHQVARLLLTQQMAKETESVRVSVAAAVAIASATAVAAAASAGLATFVVVARPRFAAASAQ